DLAGARGNGADPRRRRSRLGRRPVPAPPARRRTVTGNRGRGRAEPGDLDFLLELMNEDDVVENLAVVRPRDREGLAEEIERSRTEPEEFGRFVIEVDGEPAGLMGCSQPTRRSRLATLGSLAVPPDFRGRHIADEAARLFQRHLIHDLGYHRL